VNVSGTVSATATGGATLSVASAAKLTTTRTINGVGFDGTANISVLDSTKLSLSGGTMTGYITGRTNTGGSVTASNDTGSFVAVGNATNAASMSFHIPALHAINMGLDTDGTFVVGGWSNGTRRMALYEAGGGAFAGNVSFNAISTNFAAVFNAISSIDSASSPLFVSEVGMGSNVFSQVLGSKSLVAGGYRDHLSIGHYRPSASNYGGIYFASAGTDSYANTYLTMMPATGQTGWSSGTPTLVNLLDRRVKKNIRDVSNPLAKVVAIADTVKHFEYINHPEGGTVTGYIAQLVEDIGFSGHVQEENPVNFEDGKLLGWEYKTEMEEYLDGDITKQREKTTVVKEGAKVKKVVRSFEQYLFPAIKELLEYTKSLEERIKILENK